MNTYGPLPNAQLLHIYGFTEAENPHDVVSVLARSQRGIIHDNTSASSPSIHSGIPLLLYTGA